MVDAFKRKFIFFTVLESISKIIKTVVYQLKTKNIVKILLLLFFVKKQRV